MKRQLQRCDHRRRISRHGFTFVELLAVIIIIGVLAAIIIPRFLGRTGQARQAVAKSNLAQIESQINIFYHDHDRLPRDMNELVNRPANIEESKWQPYLKPSQLIDPWGKPFQYKQPGDHSAFDLWSYGADGKPGGEGEDADVTNWE